MSLSHKFTILDHLMTVLDQEHAEAIVEFRRFTIKKPLTAYGAKLLAARLGEWHDPNAAADTMIERAWQGFRIEWMRQVASRSSGKRTYADVALDRFADVPPSVFDGRH